MLISFISIRIRIFNEAVSQDFWRLVFFIKPLLLVLEVPGRYLRTISFCNKFLQSFFKNGKNSVVDYTGEWMLKPMHRSVTALKATLFQKSDCWWTQLPDSLRFMFLKFIIWLSWSTLSVSPKYTGESISNMKNSKIFDIKKIFLGNFLMGQG